MREYVLTLLVAAAVTYLLTPAGAPGADQVPCRHPASGTGTCTPPRSRGWAALAMYLGVAAGLLVASSLVPLRNAFHGTGLVVGLLGAGGLIVVVGIIDDRWGIGALGKLAGQVARGRDPVRQRRPADLASPSRTTACSA